MKGYIKKINRCIMKNNVVGWFEIPVADMDRAIKFYETVFEFKIDRNQLGPLDMGWFPWVENGLGSGGSLVYHPDQEDDGSNAEDGN